MTKGFLGTVRSTGRLQPVAIALALMVAIVAGVAGCTPPSGGSSTPSGASSAGASPTPTSSSPAMPVMTGQEVLTITATGNTPIGAMLDVSMEVYYPVAFDSVPGQAIINYLMSTGDTSNVSDTEYLSQRGALLQLIKITATDRQQEGIAWDSSTGVIPVYGPGLADTIVDIPHALIGANLRQQITGPGTGYAVSAFFFEPGSGLPVITADQWATFFMFYGFFEPADPSYYTVPECDIQLTVLGSATPQTASWTKDTCTIGIGD